MVAPQKKVPIRDPFGIVAGGGSFYRCLWQIFIMFLCKFQGFLSDLMYKGSHVLGYYLFHENLTILDPKI